jgi:hypothetical protein
MAKLNVNEILNGMLGAAQGVFDKKWPAIKDFAEPEFEKLARTLVQIETLKVKGQIDEAEASVMLEMQKNTAETVMKTLKGMSEILVEGAINAALAVVKDSVNSALGFALL